MRSQTVAVGAFVAAVLGTSMAAHAQGVGYSSGSGYRGGDHFGLVLQANAEYGGDNVLKVFYRNGDTQNIKAGQGVTLAIGAHYQPASIPVDFTATVGYKFVRTGDYHTDLGIDRVVIAFTGTYNLPHNFWVDAGPVWHTGTKLKGDGWVPDINFDDAVGVTLGAGWRWFGISYTNIKYSSPVTGSVDGSSVGATFAWKF